MMSNGRVYDPIHDVFQVQNENDLGSLVLSKNAVLSQDTYTQEDGTIGREMDHDDESTQSDEARQLVDYHRNGSLKQNHMTPTKKKGKEPSRYTRHLKKQDGEQFTRKDIQYAFLYELLSDKRQIFENIFRSTFSITAQESDDADTLNVTDVNYNARFFIANKKLTFSQLYVLTIASSKKCSKILRDKLLFDHQVAFSTCVLSLLVNFGRLNTTVNFFPEMTSQLRTFHSIPCLQHQRRDPKSLQDTPRIKSILKTIPLGQEPLKLSTWYSSTDRKFRPNIVNLLFTICDNPQIVNVHFVLPYIDADTTLFEIFDSPKYQPKDRASFFLWLAYIHLETSLTPEDIQPALKLFGIDDKFPMRLATQEYDIDTEAELIFGSHQNQRRLRFLKKHPRKALSDTQGGSDQNLKDENLGDMAFDSGPTNSEEANDETYDVLKPPAKPAPKQAKMRPRTRVKVVHQESSQDLLKPAIAESTPAEASQQEEDFSSWAQTVDEMIEADSNYQVAPDLTHSEAQALLLRAHKVARKKRQELGLIKAFDEYEDIALATVIGVRGKKRKKFSDGVLGYETDYMNYMHTAKKIFLKSLDQPLPEQHFNL
ncbi:HGL026Cp [Eremothecium sinecaudum]|uniref:HGL026Cp n=1 Tax=Eremothecium sinecaudum TaxID=45286 RepID=A0A0X8HVR0_9SACH|nr:HGL026Cp [Eremothecium sinecaudum]AMD22314.1 HGL026Cp [Eremothecium sinecaudum]